MTIRVVSLVIVLALTFPAANISWSQVTTATLYGIVTDPTGASVPGATITLVHQETNSSTSRTADSTGEFTFDFLRIGSYNIQIEAAGFKKSEVRGLELTAGQTVRRTFAIEVGNVTETVTVNALAPLVNTASSEQSQTFESSKVTELPLGRRNVSSILRVAPGVDIGNGRSPRLNGIGASGTGISVDGTDANSNPEQRSMSQYGARNYIDVMSIDAVQEVQVVRGILPAEYGGVVGGQVNLIAKSGTNQWHGSAFENYQSHVLNARNPFVAARTAGGATIPKPRIVFNQFGGSLGAPVIHDRAFGFVAYEGYRESASQRVNGTVPTQEYRNEILRTLPFPEMKALLDTLPLPNVPVNADVGNFEGIRNAISRENHVTAKSDIRLTQTSNWAVTYTRMRPFGLDPRYNTGGANDRTYSYAQERVASSYTIARPAWTSESRFGYNFNDMQRLDQFLTKKDPSGAAERAVWGRSLPRISVSGTSGFSAGAAEIWDMNGTVYSFDQKISHVVGKHSLKFGGRYLYNSGFRSNPENPAFSFQNRADFLANIPSSVVPSFGSPQFIARMREFGLFIQDDWRATPRLVLNLGLRYDFYGKCVAEPTTDIPAGIYNLAPPTDWSKFNFGPARDPKDPYNNDPWVNLGPRLGFAYTLDAQGKTVVRGGFGTLFSSQIPAVVRQAVAHPIVPFRVTWSLSEARDLGLTFPKYTDQMQQIVERQSAQSGTLFPFSALNPGLQNPYAMHYQFNLQRALTSTLMIETGYVGVRGVKFILHRRPNLPDRLTGNRPNPNIIFGGYYADNSQNTVYNAWQTSVRKRFSRGFTFDAHYTRGKSLGLTGGDIGAYYGSDNDSVNIQEFSNPRADRGPNPGDVVQRFVGDWVYEVPALKGANPLVRHAIGGWQISGILSARTGERLIITETCASSYHCRPDYVGGSTVVDNWKNAGTTRCIVGARCTVQYLNRNAFQLVPTDPNTRIAIRPGNLGNGAVRGPGSWSVDFSLAKNFRLREQMNLQFRTDMFNSLNHVNYGSPSTGLNGATFGEISGAGGMRVMQLNAKLNW
jgi:hypothetical protein